MYFAVLNPQDQYFSCISRLVKIIKNPKENTSNMLDVEEVNHNGYYPISPNKLDVKLHRAKNKLKLYLPVVNFNC
jgi:hypothetical protein